jgi:DNA mismatch repair protein MutL
MPIQVLSKQLANQIAAGEVIEGPMSVVKECVENAIDAQASQITITLEKGGHSRIQIVDNGLGMDKADLEKCILPHATSKISQYNDLHAIGTLGFRGEALASIASVAELTITSKTKEMEHAFKGHAKPTPSGCDTEWSMTPASHLVGTTVCIEDLFYLTPARKKFMKSERSDLKKITDWVQTLALTQWDVGFTLIHEGKNKLVLPVADSWGRVEQRMASILGETFLKHAMYIDHKTSGLRLHGWISMPQYDRGTPDQQYTFVNHRHIKDKIMIKAAKQAYQKLLFHGRHAAYVLYLECDPKVVDVNVHPTKSEVRFADSRSIFQLIQTTLTTSLKEVPVYVTDREETAAEVSESCDVMPSGDPGLALPLVGQTERWHREGGADKLDVPEAAGYPGSPSAAYASQETVAVVEKPYVLRQPIADYQLSLKPEQTEQVTNKQDLGQAIAQCHHRYILAQNAMGLIVVDQHAAHERILFEKLKHQALHHTTKQKLLIPEEVVLESFDQELVSLFKNQLEIFGFEALLNATGLTIVAMPSVLQKIKLTPLVQESWLTWIHEEGREQKVDYIIDRLLANMACKAAIKVNHPLNIVQMNAILRDMEQVPYGGLCNHGRPAVRFFDLDSMDKWFLRGQ